MLDYEAEFFKQAKLENALETNKNYEPILSYAELLTITSRQKMRAYENQIDALEAYCSDYDKQLDLIKKNPALQPYLSYLPNLIIPSETLNKNYDEILGKLTQEQLVSLWYKISATFPKRDFDLLIRVPQISALVNLISVNACMNLNKQQSSNSNNTSQPYPGSFFPMSASSVSPSEPTEYVEYIL